MVDLSIETKLSASHGQLVAGLDEAGRGPWAGPVSAAVVILDPQNMPDGINDSKKLSAGQRGRLAVEIKASSLWAIADADVSEVDRLGPKYAALLAMRRALEKLPVTPNCALIDGLDAPDLPFPTFPVIRGDQLSATIAAASILAKTHRDAIMIDSAKRWPDYGFDKHKGYGTADHAKALDMYGPCDFHRKSFRPIRNRLGYP